MNSLTQKRLVSYNNRPEFGIDSNTDDTGDQLDNLIKYTTTAFSGIINYSLAILVTQSTPVIDIGVQGQLYTFIWLGTKDSTYLNYSVEASSDNVTFFPYIRAVFTQTATTVETHYLMPFRYHKVTVFNNNASTAANTNLHYAGRI